MRSKKTAYIGLGANLNNPQQQIKDALVSLSKLDASELMGCSSFYQTQPMGPQDQADYINAVAQLSTELSPHELLTSCQKIEQQQGRIRKNQRWGPRTLDLDILLYDNEVIHSKTLVVPHYGIKLRNFVLNPLFEIAPDLIFPDGSVLAELVATTDQQGIKRL